MPNGSSQLSFSFSGSRRGLVVDRNILETGETASITDSTPPITWLKSLPECGVLLCTEHQTCYIPGANLREHLLRKHFVKGEVAKEIQSWVVTQNVTAAVRFPADNSAFIHGLQFHNDFLCTATESCSFRIASKEIIGRHCSKEHGVDTRRKQRERSLYRRVMLQCLFAKATEYWIVQTELGSASTPSRVGSGVSGAINPDRSTPRGVPSPQLSVSSSRLTPRNPNHTVAHALAAQIDDELQRDKERYRQTGEPNHVSEVTPWLQKSQFHKHLAGLDADDIATSRAAPQSEDEPRLFHRAFYNRNLVDQVTTFPFFLPLVDRARQAEHFDTLIFSIFPMMRE